jgi:NodT family efflux transporter outer membrane factor (OMF) lipoprotein
MHKTLLFTITVLAACAPSPGYRESSVPVPVEFRESVNNYSSPARAPEVPAVAATVEGAAHTPDDFWQALGDTTLNRLLEEVSRQNLDLRGAEARVGAARAARERALMDLTPSLGFSGGYARQRLSSATFPQAGGGVFPDQDIWDAGFDASWELDVFGRLRHNVRAQGAFNEAAQEDLRDVQVSLRAEVSRAYFELRGAQEQLGVARRNADNQKRTLDLTQERLDAGRGTAFDTERARAQLATTLASIPSREADVAAASYRIGVLVGRAPAVVAAELAPVNPMPSLPDVPTMGSPEVVVKYRPDVAAAERFAASQRALVSAAKAEYLPRLSLGATAGYTSGDFSALGDNGTFRYGVGPTISWPGLNLGRVRAAVNQRRALEDEAQAQYGQTVLRAMEDLENSLSRYRTSRERVERLTEASVASERAAELARLRFREGVTDFLQVLDSERTQLESQDQLARSRTDAAIAYAALYKAVGGRWQ